MKKLPPHSYVPAVRRAVLLMGAGLTLACAGCYNGSAGASVAYAAPAGGVAVEDSYEYYPGYEMYYNNTRHHYVYREGNAWVTRPKPPSQWEKELPHAASVHMDFHDAPEHHHADVARTYPKTWKPAATAPAPQRAPADEHREQH